MKADAHILVIRFSAMGDVALSVPVLRELLDAHPQLKITVLTRASFAPLFSGLPRTTVFTADLSGKHKGLTGLFALFQTLKKMDFDAVADIHDVLRSRIIRGFFRLISVPVSVIDKGRKEKKQLTRRHNKILKPLKPTTERYADVFRKLGFDITLSHQLKRNVQPLPGFMHKKSIGAKTSTWIGIAPFAKHTGKQYPPEMTEQVIAGLDKNETSLFVFGGGENEKNIAAKWASSYPSVQNIIGKMSLQEELALISNLDVMLTMDSSGMHLASIVGTPVISIWGASHPFAGFLGYGQSEDNALMHPVECRPCSVFGNKRCFRTDDPYVCLKGLKAVEVVGKVGKVKGLKG